MDRIRQREIENASIDVDVSDAHKLAVSQPMPAAGSAPDQRVRSALQVVKIIAQARDVDQAVNRQLTQPAEKVRNLPPR